MKSSNDARELLTKFCGALARTIPKRQLTLWGCAGKAAIYDDFKGNDEGVISDDEVPQNESKTIRTTLQEKSRVA